jgi:nucleotide-binding universal stress UspA family protein
MFQKILVGLDGSKSSWRAFAKALEIARHMGAELHALTVEESQARRPEGPDAASQEDSSLAEMTLSGSILMQARQRGMEVGVEVHGRSVEGHEIRTILAITEKGKFDLLVVGRTGHSKVFQDQAGSTATMLMLRAPCALLAVP